MSGKLVKYRFYACIYRISINKNIKFKTKVLWKRHGNKIQTTLADHAHGYSIFNETISLDLNLSSNGDIFDDKNTQIVVMIMMEGKIKSGGYAKYNVSRLLNEPNLQNQTLKIPLLQCPDSQAYIEMSFNFEKIGDNEQAEISILQTSSRDLNMSRINFHDDTKMSEQINKINQTVNKLYDMAYQIQNKAKDNQVPELLTKLHVLEGENKTLQETVIKLEQSLSSQDEQYRQNKLESQKRITNLEKQLQKKEKKIKTNGDENLLKYKKLYEQTLQQLERLKNDSNINLRNSLGFDVMNVQDVNQIASFENQSQHMRKSDQNLKKQNSQLLSRVTSMSYQMAKIFNASYEYGGPKLVDFLQTAIGLTQI